MKIGVLTGGGDSSAINAAIRAIVHKGVRRGHTFVGVRYGWAGLVKGEHFDLTESSVSGILPKGGTMLGTSRTNPFKMEGGVESVLENASKMGLDALIAIGGDDTLGVANKLSALPEPLRCVGIPQTIDNDLKGTDFSIGYDTALTVATDAVDKLHTTAESHHRVMVIEVMGRDAGHIALNAGLAGGANVILVPEEKFKVDDVCNVLKARADGGHTFSLVVVAEGAVPEGSSEQVVQDAQTDAFGHARLGGIAEWLAKQIEECIGIETRSMNLGHLQRGGTPTAFDRLLSTRFGLHAIDLVESKKYGYMVSVRGDQITEVPLSEATSGTRLIDMDLFRECKYLS